MTETPHAQTIVLIGPMAAGKSTVGELLAEKLKRPAMPIDEHRWDYYNEIGYDGKKADEIFTNEGLQGIIPYWKPFEAHAVERVLADFPGHIIDFGAGHSVFEDEALFKRVQQALAPCPNVILLLPSADLDESIAIVNARFAAQMAEEGEDVSPYVYELNAHFTKHPSNARLATMTIYTKDKTPEQTCDEIVARLQGADTPE